MTAANGGKRDCGLCDGNGTCDYGEGDEPCRSCSGTGYVWPSVEGEVVAVVSGRQLVGVLPLGVIEHTSPQLLYQILCQPLPAAQKEDDGA